MTVEGSGASPEPASDLEYDLAHESAAEGGADRPARAGRQDHPEVYVATETAGFDGDYGYDLAHDVPKQ